MSQPHADQMTYLLYFIGFLLFVIVGVITASFLKKKKETPTLTSRENDPETKAFQKRYVGEDIASVTTVDEILTEARKQQGPKIDINPIDIPYPHHEDQPRIIDPSVESTTESALESLEYETDSNLKKALKKTEESFFGRIKSAFTKDKKSDVLEEVEEILYTSDLGPTTVQKLIEVVDNELSSREMKDISLVKTALKTKMTEILQPLHVNLADKKFVHELSKQASGGPTVIMIVGVNGAGKTTSIGKMAAQLAKNGKKVLVAAGDTFRAAAGGQLKQWTERAQVEIFWPENTTDPSAVAYDSLLKAKAQNFDFLLLDTAGRLHTQGHLMEELKKVKRVMKKVIPEAPHETWIVLDANSGQNALMQAKEFNQALELTGAIMTKMDGTAKGGVVLGVVDQIGIPVKLVGIGEKIGDLKPFDYVEYVDSILGT